MSKHLIKEKNVMIKHAIGKVMTPNQAAKFIIADLGIMNWWNWQERVGCLEVENMTQRDVDNINIACSKQAERVHKFLEMSKITSFLARGV